MTPRLTPCFVREFRSLPVELQCQAREALRLWSEHPRHASLHYRRVCSKLPVYAMRGGPDCRLLALRGKQYIDWFWVGTRHDYAWRMKKFKP